MTTNEIDDEMISFFQRSLSQNKATGVPRPFEITETVQSFDTVPFKKDEQTPSQTPIQSALGPPKVGLLEIFGNNGSLFAGTRRTLRGTNFVSGCEVFFGAVQAQHVEFINANYISCDKPAYPNPTGEFKYPVDVKVRNTPTATFSTLEKGFTYFRGPQPESITPASGPGNGGTPFQIHGPNIGFASGFQVAFGNALTNVESVFVGTPAGTYYYLQGVTPAHGEGVVTVRVIAPDFEQQTGELVNAFTYGVPAPLPTPGPDYFQWEAPQISFLINGAIYNAIVTAHKNGQPFDTYNGQVHIVHNPGGSGGANAILESVPNPITFVNGQASFQIRATIQDTHTDGSVYVALSDGAIFYYPQTQYWSVLR